LPKENEVMALSLFPMLTDAKALPGYKLSLRYEDGVSGVVDLSGWVGNGVFSAWNDPERFFNFSIDKWGKLIWSDEIDMDPDAFYLELIGKTFEEYARDQQVLRDHH